MFYAKSTVLSDFTQTEINCAMNILNALLYPRPLPLYKFLNTSLKELAPKLLKKVNQVLSG